MAAADLTAARLRELLSYDPDTGTFRWRYSRQKAKAGSVAGSLHRTAGYILIGIDGHHHYAHRLAWLYTTGGWPSNTIDHIDGDRKNNRWSNLRDVPHSVNVENVRKPRRHSASQLLGARQCKKSGRWDSHITINKRLIYLGSFATAREAHEAYLAAKRERHAGCTI